LEPPARRGSRVREGPGTQRSLTETGRPQDAFSVRDKNIQKGNKTADKWNQQCARRLTFGLERH
jgi:hypothetical protein